MNNPRCTIATTADAQILAAVADVDVVSRVDGRGALMPYLTTRVRTAIETLDFVGHGDDGELLFSDDLRFDDTTISALFPAADHPAQKDGPTTYGICEIRLHCCDTGSTTASVAAMTMLHSRLGIPVYGALEPVDSTKFDGNGFKLGSVPLKEVQALVPGDIVGNKVAVSRWRGKLPPLRGQWRALVELATGTWPRHRRGLVADALSLVEWAATSKGLLSAPRATIRERPEEGPARALSVIGGGYALRIDPLPGDNVAPAGHSIVLGLRNRIPDALVRDVFRWR